MKLEGKQVLTKSVWAKYPFALEPLNTSKVRHKNDELTSPEWKLIFGCARKNGDYCSFSADFLIDFFLR